MYHKSGLRELAAWPAQGPTEQKGWRAYLCSVSKSVKGMEHLKLLRAKSSVSGSLDSARPGAEDHAQKNMGCDQNPAC